MEKITLFNIFKFELPLAKELIVKNNKLNRREGLLINIELSNGLSGFGEISPLPFFHNESIEDAILQVKELKQNDFFKKKIENIFKKPDSFDLLASPKNTRVEDSDEELYYIAFMERFYSFLNELNDLFYGIKIFPSVRTGFEMALISLLFIRPGIELIFQSALYSDLPVCKLIMDLKKDLKKEILETIKNEFKAVKIKTGRLPQEKEIHSVKEIKNLISQNQRDTLKIRIDANGLWSFSEALFFGKAVGSSLIEYIEDPFSNISEYEQFFKQTGIPVALDEKLADFLDLNDIDGLNQKCPDYLKAVIIKPDLAGGFFKTANLINFFRNSGIKPVLSNSFNSSLLISFIVLFAGIMRLNDTPLGIDSLSLFSENLLAEDIKIVNGKINILEVLNNIKKINFNLLRPAGF